MHKGGMAMHEVFWDIFAKTGSISAYMAYRETTARKGQNGDF